MRYRAGIAALFALSMLWGCGRGDAGKGVEGVRATRTAVMEERFAGGMRPAQSGGGDGEVEKEAVSTQVVETVVELACERGAEVLAEDGRRSALRIPEARLRPVEKRRVVLVEELATDGKVVNPRKLLEARKERIDAVKGRGEVEERWGKW